MNTKYQLTKPFIITAKYIKISILYSAKILLNADNNEDNTWKLKLSAKIIYDLAYSWQSRGESHLQSLSDFNDFQHGVVRLLSFILYFFLNNLSVEERKLTSKSETKTTLVQSVCSEILCQVGFKTGMLLRQEDEFCQSWWELSNFPF